MERLTWRVRKNQVRKRERDAMSERLVSDVIDQAQQKAEAFGLSALLVNEMNKDLLKKAIPLGKFTAGMGLALSAIEAADAAVNADKLYGTTSPTVAERLAAAAGSAANSASFGVVPADKAALGLVPRKYITKEEFDKLVPEYKPHIQK